MNIMILGGNGYLGWNLGINLAMSTEHKILLVDNYQKLRWADELNLHSLVCQSWGATQIKRLNCSNLSFIEIDANNREEFTSLFKNDYKPDVIFCFAHQPSAPFSMIDINHHLLTLEHNQSVTLSVLHTTKQYCPETLLVFSGSAGCYENTDIDFIPKEKINFHGCLKGRNISLYNTWLPMQANDFYHQSKVITFGLIDMCVKLWNLRAITIQQNTIFGIDNGLSQEYFSNFYYDEIFGTVVNRFITQNVIGMPMSVYGHGNNKTGLIPLRYAIETYKQIISMEPYISQSEHRMEHNLTITLSINTIAKLIQSMWGGEIEYLENPRFSQEQKLAKIFEYGSYNMPIQEKDFLKEIESTYEYVKENKEYINKNFITPTVNWRI